MLPKSWRLPRPDFIRVKKTGKLYRTAQYSYFVLHNSFNHNRYSVVISKKICPKAVNRNTFRRQIYSSVASLPGHRDVIIYPTPMMLKLTYDQICAVVNSSLSPNS